MSTLLDADGKPITRVEKPSQDEAASILLSLIPMFGGLLEPDDDTLATRGGGRGLKIYRDLERDAQAWAVLDKRKRAVVARPWKVVPASERPRDKAMAELVESQLKRLPFDRICHELLDATLMGYAVGEIMWEVSAREVRAAAVISRAQTRFKFDVENGLRLLTRDNQVTGKVMPARKFIIHRRGGADNNPYGLGLGTRLFWPVFFKRQDITFWLSFLDKFGSPSPVGKYPNGATDAQKRTLLQALQRLRSEAVTIIPEGMLVDLLEAKRAGNTDAFEKLARYMDEQIALIVLGETMSTTATASGLGSGQAEVHNEVRLELAKADADLLTDTLAQTLISWIVLFNDPSAGVPSVERDFAEPEDQVKKAQRDKTLTEAGLEPDDEYIAENWPGWRRKAAPAPTGREGEEGEAESTGDGSQKFDAGMINAYSMGLERLSKMGVDVPENFVRTIFDIPRPKRGEKVLVPSSAEEPASFAAPDEAADGQVAVDRALDALPETVLASLVEGALRPVVERLVESGDADEALQALAEAYPDIDTSAMQQMLARAIFVVETWARIEAKEGL